VLQFAEYFKPTPTIDFWQTVRQVGVDNVISELEDRPDGRHDNTGDRPWDYVPLARLKERYESAGLTLAGIEDWPPMDRARLGLTGRDEEIEHVCTLVRNMGRLGIPMFCYNWMACVNWSRTSTTRRGRGDALVTAFQLSELRAAPPTWAGEVPPEQLWDAFEYFLARVVPVAEKAGVRLALHPDDPPIPTLRGMSRIMIRVEAFERVLALADSEANAICLCQGNFTLFCDDLPAVIRRFGSEGRIAFGHFRDVRGTPTDFVETFHDNGMTDMLACMEAWHDFDFDGVLRPDHVPTLAGEPNDDPSYALQGRLHAIGYMQGLREAAVRTHERRAVPTAPEAGT
jgi:mannonate dehydratase